VNVSFLAEFDPVFLIFGIPSQACNQFIPSILFGGVPIKNINEEADFLKRLMKMLAMEFGNNCEVVLHDLSLDYDHTIVDILNNHITGRSIGGSGSNLGLEVLRGTVKDGDRYSYITYTRDGKILRSSTVYIKDDDGKVIGALCINLDITESIKFESFLKKMNQYSIAEGTQEVFVDNVNDLLDYLLQEAEKFVDKPIEKMSKDDKIKFLKYLDEKGAFMISKSGERVCKHLGVSKFTLYNYLDMIRKNVKREETEEVDVSNPQGAM
jgi:predicted transcriptional regulator YheO